MSIQQGIHHQSRLDPANSEIIRVRIERPIATTLKALQDLPHVQIKDTRKPSRSLLVRRAIQVYAEYLRNLEGIDAERENAALHKLA